MLTRLKLPADHSGATAIEYALIAAGIATVLIATISILGGQASNALTVIATAIGA